MKSDVTTPPHPYHLTRCVSCGRTGCVTPAWCAAWLTVARHVGLAGKAEAPRDVLDALDLLRPGASDRLHPTGVP